MVIYLRTIFLGTMSLVIGAGATAIAIYIFASWLIPDLMKGPVVNISFSSGIWLVFGIFFLGVCVASFLILRHKSNVH